MPYKHLRPPVDVVNRSAIDDGKAEDITVAVSFKLTSGSGRQMSNQTARSTAAHILLSSVADEECEEAARERGPVDLKVRRKAPHEEMRVVEQATEAKKPTLWFNDQGEVFSTDEWEIIERRLSWPQPKFYAVAEAESGRAVITSVAENFAERWSDNVTE